MALNKDLFGKIPVTEVGKPITTRVSMGPTRRGNPNQYKMFMRPREIMSTVTDSVDRDKGGSHTLYGFGGKVSTYETEPETMDDVWEKKDSESDYIVDSLKRGETIRHPVTLQEVYPDYDPDRTPELHMGQGHHRVAGALRYEQETGQPVYIPVVHDSDWNYTDSNAYAEDYLDPMHTVGDEEAPKVKKPKYAPNKHGI